MLLYVLNTCILQCIFSVHHSRHNSFDNCHKHWNMYFRKKKTTGNVYESQNKNKNNGKKILEKKIQLDFR